MLVTFISLGNDLVTYARDQGRSRGEGIQELKLCLQVVLRKESPFVFSRSFLYVLSVSSMSSILVSPFSSSCDSRGSIHYWDRSREGLLLSCSLRDCNNSSSSLDLVTHVVIQEELKGMWETGGGWGRNICVERRAKSLVLQLHVHRNIRQENSFPARQKLLFCLHHEFLWLYFPSLSNDLTSLQDNLRKHWRWMYHDSWCRLKLERTTDSQTLPVTGTVNMWFAV